MTTAPPTTCRSYRSVLNSTIAYVLAFLVTTVLHELGHALVGAWLGSQPILHHNFVEHPLRMALPITDQAAIALAGPLVSLVQGLLLVPVVLKFRGGGMLHLFVLWCMMLAFGNALGYLMTGPIFTAGDIGKVEALLNVPMSIRIIIAFVGAALLTLVAYKSTAPFLRFAHDDRELADGNARMDFNKRVIIWPWLIGASVITLLYLPVVAVVSIIYPISSGMVLIFPWRHAKRVTDALPQGDEDLGKAAWPWYVGLLLMILFFRLVLAPGIRF